MVVANYMQIIEEWKQRGLTDTSYKVLLTMLTGSILVSKGLLDGNQTALAGAFLGSAALSGVMLIVKVNNLFQTRFKTLK